MPYVHELQGYIPIEGPSLFPNITEEQLKAELTLGELNVLKQHALCLACLAGNAFPSLINQYLVDAYNNLWSNGCLGVGEYEAGIKIRNLYPMTASEHWTQGRVAQMIAAGIDPESPTAENDFFNHWMSQSTKEEESPLPSLAIVEDGYVKEVLLDRPDLLDLAVAEVRNIAHKFSNEES